MSDGTYLIVKVLEYDAKKDEAYTRIRYEPNKWVPSVLNKSSLVSLDIREGEIFEWIPQKDGIVRSEHIRNHPRREESGESERTEKVFDDLAALARELSFVI